MFLEATIHESGFEKKNSSKIIFKDFC